jgi:hypothetical protein
LRDWKQAVACWHDISPWTPFQHPQWYDAWYAAFAGAEGVARLPLIDISAALSWRGWRFALRDRAVGRLRNHLRLDARLRRVFGKPLPHEEN